MLLSKKQTSRKKRVAEIRRLNWNAVISCKITTPCKNRTGGKVSPPSAPTAAAAAETRLRARLDVRMSMYNLICLQVLEVRGGHV